MALIRLHPEGRRWILGTFLVGGVLLGLLIIFNVSVEWSGGIGALWLVWAGLLLNFFRYPRRICPADPALLYAPCDGKVVGIKRTFEPKYFHAEMQQISIFMSPLNVHVNWAPAAGRVVEKQHNPGLYKVAWHPKASLLNEQTFLAVEGSSREKSYAVRQIAGALARRISTYPQVGQRIQAGEEIGFIKFGSRVDVLLPLSAKVQVHVGMKVRGAITPIAQW
ncbi:MAG: phosphatidylserine decarboxylase [Bacteroidia bacterium]|nr:phosphatidylserine decarboxylase [Bacteroidia bacterium]